MTVKTQSGFTLIEVMIVVVIIAIIASVAVSSYGEYTKKARRTDARTTLTETASKLEKCRALYGVYNNSNCSISNGDKITSPKSYYSITVTSANSTFKLSAAAQGAQAQDTDCKELTLNNLGQQGGTKSDCW